MKARIEALMARYAPKTQPAVRRIFGKFGSDATSTRFSWVYGGGRQAARSQPADPKDKLAEQEAYESGLTSLYSGLYGKAILRLQRIVMQDPRNLPALCALGEAWLRSGNPAASSRAMATSAGAGSELSSRGGIDRRILAGAEGL